MHIFHGVARSFAPPLLAVSLVQLTACSGTSHVAPKVISQHPISSGHFRRVRSIICSNSADCAALGYPGSIIVISVRLTGCQGNCGGGGDPQELISLDRGGGGGGGVDCDLYPDDPRCTATYTINCDADPSSCQDVSLIDPYETRDPDSKFDRTEERACINSHHRFISVSSGAPGGGPGLAPGETLCSKSALPDPYVSPGGCPLVATISDRSTTVFNYEKGGLPLTDSSDPPRGLRINSDCTPGWARPS